MLERKHSRCLSRSCLYSQTWKNHQRYNAQMIYQIQPSNPRLCLASLRNEKLKLLNISFKLPVASAMIYRTSFPDSWRRSSSNLMKSCQRTRDLILKLESSPDCLSRKLSNSPGSFWIFLCTNSLLRFFDLLLWYLANQIFPFKP